MPRPDKIRDQLVDLFAETYGFKLPLRGFQRTAIQQIDGARIEAILAAGWEPNGFRAQYEASQAALSELMTEHRKLREALDALADEWETQGFAEHPGRYYAERVRDHGMNGTGA